MKYYKELADNDPGGDVQAAFDAMNSETIDTTPIKRMSYADIAREVGYQESAALESVVDAAISSNGLAKWVKSRLERDGIDVNDSQTQALLTSLIGATEAAKIISAGIVKEKKFPYLTSIQQLTNARYARAKGVI